MRAIYPPNYPCRSFWRRASTVVGIRPVRSVTGVNVCGDGRLTKKNSIGYSRFIRHVEWVHVSFGHPRHLRYRAIPFLG